MPIYIKKLDFKTREELQSMPQTEEEHLENQYLDYEEKEKSITDAEVSIMILLRISNIITHPQYHFIIYIQIPPTSNNVDEFFSLFLL